MPIEFKQTPFNDYEAFSNQCLIGSIEQRDDGNGTPNGAGHSVPSRQRQDGK